MESSDTAENAFSVHAPLVTRSLSRKLDISAARRSDKPQARAAQSRLRTQQMADVLIGLRLANVGSNANAMVRHLFAGLVHPSLKGLVATLGVKLFSKSTLHRQQIAIDLGICKIQSGRMDRFDGPVLLTYDASEQCANEWLISCC